MVAYSWRVNSTLYFAHVSTRIRDFVSNVGVILLKPRGRAMPFRKLFEISIYRNQKLCNLVEQMNQNYVHHVSVKEHQLWFIFGPEKYKNINYIESTPKSRSVRIAHFFKTYLNCNLAKLLRISISWSWHTSFSRKVNLKPTHSTVVKLKYLYVWSSNVVYLPVQFIHECTIKEHLLNNLISVGMFKLWTFYFFYS